MDTIIELINTSMLLGALHTLAAPNLAALATISGIDIIDHRDDDLDDNSKKQRRKGRSFFLGIQWGLGNAFGVLMIGIILIGLQSSDPNGDWSWMDDWFLIAMRAFVGAFLIILGIYGLIKALKNREFNTADIGFKKSCSDSDSNSGIGSEITEIRVNRAINLNAEELSSGSEGSASEHNPISYRRQSGNDDSVVAQMLTCLDSSDVISEDNNCEDTLGLSEYELRMWKAAKSLSDNLMLYAEDDYSHSSSSRSQTNSNFDLGKSFTTVKVDWDAKKGGDYFDDTPVLTKEASSFRSGSNNSSQNSSKRILRKLSKCGSCICCTPGILAVFAGLLYGISGPGETLALMPAVQLKQVHLAVLYVVTFCFSSTLVMGVFSSFYRGICKWMVERGGRKEDASNFSRAFLIEGGSACLSIIVGIVWITLLVVGDLEVVIP